MSKKEKKEKNILLIVTIVIVLATFILFIVSKINPNVEDELSKEGYETQEEDDPFYKKIVTNNTLEEYYNDVSAQKDSSYEEYYFSKESNNFIELKLDYKSKINTTLNISSDLRNKDVKYNYELSYNKSYLIIDGNSNDDYNCNIVVKKNIKDETIQKLCDDIMSEITIFLERRETLLSNKKIKDLINEPLKEYVEVDEF